MKRFIIKMVGVGVIILVVIALAFSVDRLRKENKRLSNNNEVLMSNSDYMLELTKRELKEYYRDIVDSLSNYGVKNIETIVRYQYRYLDTTIVKDTLIFIYDTIRDDFRASFAIDDDCFTIEGDVLKNGTIEVNKREFRDTAIVAMYKEKRCFRRAKYKAIAISYCSGDTLGITDYIKVVR